MKYPTSKSFGMTLVEVLVVSGIYTVLSLVLFTSIQSIYQNNSYTFAQADEVAEARRGLYVLTQDVREMTYGEEGSYPIRILENNRFGFYSDIDKDDNVEYVEYELATTTFYKYTHNPTGSPPSYDFTTPDEIDTLSEYVQNIEQATSTFYYYDNEGTQLSGEDSLTDVRYIQAQIIVNIDPLRSPGEFLLRSSVAPRNLKDNL